MPIEAYVTWFRAAGGRCDAERLMPFAKGLSDSNAPLLAPDRSAGNLRVQSSNRRA